MLAGWIRHVFVTEIKRMISYRFDFWIHFLSGIVVQFGLAYFLWDAIFTYRQIDSLGGYHFYGLMLYYLMVPLIDRIIRGPEMAFLSNEIYEGTLSRYLIYPVPVFAYLYVIHLAQGTIYLIQFVCVATLFVAFFPVPSEFHVTASSIAMGFASIFSASILYFLFASIFEAIAFWADNVWSLLVMLRLVIFFLGGGMIPLSFFPAVFSDLLSVTPFPYLTSFPIRCFQGVVTGDEFLLALLVEIGWSACFALFLKRIWKRGLLQYTGVGI